MLNAIKLPFLLAISGYTISRGTIKCQIARLILPVHQYETTLYTSNFYGHKNYSFLQKGNSCISTVIVPSIKVFRHQFSMINCNYIS
jgi:hypothetical protein